MIHSTLALSLLLIAVTSNLAMAIKKEKRAPQTLSRGWGDEITWVQTYEEGLYQAKKSNKPLMVIHHLEDCQYCQALKKAFAENEEIQEMAQNNFVMLNLMHETTDKNLSPDGQYVPRIMFVESLEGLDLWWQPKFSEMKTTLRQRAVQLQESINYQKSLEGKLEEEMSTTTCSHAGNVKYHEISILKSLDPSLTVRADITGRYSNRLYTYEPQDIPFLIENMKKALRLIQTEL